MTLIRSLIGQATLVAEYYLYRLGRDTRTETGAMSTEAVALAALVAIFRSKVEAIAESIPETGFGGSGG